MIFEVLLAVQYFQFSSAVKVNYIGSAFYMQIMEAIRIVKFYLMHIYNADWYSNLGMKFLIGRKYRSSGQRYLVSTSTAQLFSADTDCLQL